MTRDTAAKAISVFFISFCPFRAVLSALSSEGNNFGKVTTLWTLRERSFGVIPSPEVSNAIPGRALAGTEALTRAFERIAEPGLERKKVKTCGRRSRSN